MRHFIVLSALAIALVAAGAASAGGWATVGLDPLPTGVGPGDTWKTDMTILQHGRTPLTGLSPTITITLDETGLSREFVAKETARPGVYEASVVFPEAGPWRVVADSTFGESILTYGPVMIEPTPGSATGGSGDFPAVPVLAALGALVLAAAAAFGLIRQRRLTPAG